jgi:transposase ISL3 family protein/transposase IS204/IS1001/IS1096/IS1165 family protein
VRTSSVFARLCGLSGAVVEAVDLDGEGVVIVHARPAATQRGRCGVCGRRCPRYDRGEGRRRWRALDLGTVQAFVEADAPRVSCRRHGVVVARVPWARHGAWHTRDFEDQAAWCASQLSRSAVCRLLRVSWRAVGGIVTRVVADRRARIADPLAGLRRIGIDEISCAPRGAITPGGMRGPPPVAATAERSWGQPGSRGGQRRRAHRPGHALPRRRLPASSWPPVTYRPTEAAGAPQLAARAPRGSGARPFRPRRAAFNVPVKAGETRPGPAPRPDSSSEGRAR